MEVFNIHIVIYLHKPDSFECLHDCNTVTANKMRNDQMGTLLIIGDYRQYQWETFELRMYLTTVIRTRSKKIVSAKEPLTYGP